MNCGTMHMVGSCHGQNRVAVVIITSSKELTNRYRCPGNRQSWAPDPVHACMGLYLPQYWHTLLTSLAVGTREAHGVDGGVQPCAWMLRAWPSSNCKRHAAVNFGDKPSMNRALQTQPHCSPRVRRGGALRLWAWDVLSWSAEPGYEHTRCKL